jgi:Protein of unknown function (DUF3768)
LKIVIAFAPPEPAPTPNHWKIIMDQHKQQSTEEQNRNKFDSIRTLNDRLRRDDKGGMTVVTAGIAALPAPICRRIYAEIASFEAFNGDNDPRGEHDCGSLNVATYPIIWKIDYYDRSRRYLSPDPADAARTIRVLTIMLAAEY